MNILTALALTLVPQDAPAPVIDFYSGNGETQAARLLAEAAPAPRRRRQEEKPGDAPGRPPERVLPPPDLPAIDFDWLELDARAGIAVFSEDYFIDPSPCLSILVRAPVPFLSPSDNSEGEYVGIFAELVLSFIERTIEPEVDKPKGPMGLFTMGFDYTIHRDTGWLLIILAGVQLAHYGGITDLQDGAAPVVGIRTGFTIGNALSLTLSPEVIIGRAGDYILLGSVGLNFEF